MRAGFVYGEPQDAGQRGGAGRKGLRVTVQDGIGSMQEPRAASREPRAASREPRAASREPGDLRVPVGADARRWRTFGGRRVLVAAARTVTSAVRLLEVLPALFRSDPRVDVVFAFDPTSAFGDGVLGLLHAAGARVMPWSQLSRTACDLVVSASENIDLTGVDCPVLVLPHGVGFHKLVPDARGTGRRLSGVMDDERAWHAVSHPDQIRQLAQHHPALADRTFLIGDPCHDRLLASRMLRTRYREELGLQDGRKLVLVSSTWGEQSLLGTDPLLPQRLLGELPLDEYRVAAVLHPNIWSAHGTWQIRAVEAAALDAGLLLIPPHRGWQAALLAADVLVGDHGSVTFYGAALGTPLLLAAFGEESVPGTPMTELGRITPRLDPHAPLAAQLERAVAEHDAERITKVANGAFAEPGRSLEQLRSALYELMKLPEPDAAGAPPLHRWPVPETGPGEVTAMWIRTSGAEQAIRVRRWPVAAGGDQDEGEGEAEFGHLSCDEEERDLRQLTNASVITSRVRAGSVEAAVQRARRLLDELPGALLACVPAPGGCSVAVLRDGRVVESTTADASLAGAVVYARFRAQRPLAGTVTLRVGRHGVDVTLRE
ncbi:CDP-glycerol glycerophosphotransferase family protein [Streptomyces sp. ET3-23]|uniref:CDP-glycerol glycerophosphotransferase family protein n=1 Tax=Streptomyces sp. ET3-23 TaxID=2885643 RepID=UPI001D0F7445|nr:CDP-glycerol glycerophosphotransferase family protein [Streptomyces sp. ET3-23]MCC2277811.1 CDP-glycerol glycerophosphotransferase family protein [Streptomyces sp. ET3-23]